MRSANSATLGVMNKVTSGSSTANFARTRETSRSAMSELPPRSKKLSSAPTRGTASTSDQIAASSSSTPGRGATYSACAETLSQSGAGSALRSNLPLDVVGRTSKATKAEGTM